MFSTPVAAEVSSSKNYQVTDTEFGSTSLQQSCSSKYCATVSIGDMTPGEKAGVAQFRTYTTGHAHLQVIIEAGSSDLGTLSTEETATKTMVVKVQNYIGAGYVVQIVGTPPTFDTHVLKALTSPSASRAGHEQFGLNVVKNTLPNVGVDPSSDSSKTVLGAAAADYDTANLFQYHSGDVVARGTSASGETDYTVSMIVNISNLTPPGHYTSNLQAVVIPTY
ncbi:MAG TPA: hypothetical protein VFQ70_03300 [Candidatus Saccharimonadaceae bacterium]|nr:hypothetical protein [Candidatus Saccharimonadaceae bacterium]